MSNSSHPAPGAGSGWVSRERAHQRRARRV